MPSLDGLGQQICDIMRRPVLGRLVAASRVDHLPAVQLGARRGHDRVGEPARAGHLDELDCVDLVARDAPIEDDRRDVVLVQGEASVEGRQGRRGHAGDAVLRQGACPALQDLGEVVGEQDERGRGGDLAEQVVAGHGDSFEG